MSVHRTGHDNALTDMDALSKVVEVVVHGL
jgi:hypothetical protein